MDRPVPPLSRYQMRGILVPFGPPLWMWEDHHRTPCGVAVSLDGKLTHPKNLTPAQEREVNDLRAVMNVYGR